MIENLNDIIETFLQWFKNDAHSEVENAYPELRNKEYFQNFNKEELTGYFFNFVKEGGKIQSGGHRTAGKFKITVEENFEKFKAFVSEPYNENFNLDNWLTRVSEFDYFGWGAATIYLNRIDKTKFAIVNNKSQKALKELGYEISGDLIGIYHSIESAQKDLMSKYPELKNFFMADALTHFLIGKEEGIKLLPDPVLDLINRYKKIKRETGHADEFYKYEAIRHFQDNWDPNAENFTEMFQEAFKKQSNLIYNLTLGTNKTISENFPDETKKLFNFLFNESVDLQERIKEFSEKVDALIKRYDPKLNGFQDERAISVYLTFRYPDKYTFYKDSYYSKACKLIEEKKAKPGKKYIHYLNLIHDFKKDYLQKDRELWELTNETLPETAWKDESLNILAQDILYVTLDQGSAELSENKRTKVSLNEYDFINQLKKIKEKRAINFHFEMIDSFMKKNDIRKDDKRLVFSSTKSNDGLAFTINQRYVFKTTKDSYRINLPAELKEKILSDPSYISHEVFKGLPGMATPAIYVYFHKNQQTINNYQKEWLKICEENLSYGVQSSFVKYGNPAYRKAAFDKAYREKIFQIAFSNAELEIEKNSLNQQTMKQINIPQNLILYGPPGTGKTYNSINIALEICGFPVPENRKDAVEIYKGLVNSEQIVFTTFHQSMSYEDFVEGIKPILVEKKENPEEREMIYDTVPGTFHKICEKAGEKEIIQNDSLLKLSSKNQVFKVSLKSDNLSHDVKEECFENDEIRIGWDDIGNLDNLFLKEQKNEYFERLGRNDKNSIQYFYELKAGDIVLIFHDLKSIDGIGIVEDDNYIFNDDYFEFKHVRKVKWISKNNPIRIFEINKETNLTLPTVYKLNRISVDDITKLIQDKGIISSKQIERNEKNYVLIIDEINRGNISKIFGELITLIEPDKRQGEENELEVTLPYSKTSFSVPPNLFIIGTMNTADRSIALIDTALRRRFHFREMMPDVSLLSTNVEGINLQLLLKKINERIEFLLDRDHTIGHSYLMKVNSKHDLCSVFKNKVIPLLQEYFYNDWEKVQLVLGDNESWKKQVEQRLVQIKKQYDVNAEKELFGFDVEDYEDEIIYEINPNLKSDDFDKIPVDAFIHIYQKPQ